MWNPDRYGSFNLPAGDAYSYDVFSQAATALKTPDPASADPLGPLEATTVIALGTPHSAGRLAAHYKSVAPLQDDPRIDAFFIGESRSALRTDLATPTISS